MESDHITAFQNRIWEYYREHGRDLPWRDEPSPYQVVVSELMLQQTQVVRVLGKYPEFLQHFPDFAALAGAPLSEVLPVWQGMGYNRRALYLQRLAQVEVSDYAGQLPQDPAELVKLPGVGPNTAGSIAAFAFNAPVVFIETNIRRVFIHEFFPQSVGAVNQPVSDNQLLPLITAALDHGHSRDWYYALMDYGADLAKHVPNPNRRSKHYAVQSKFEGSLRQIRGEILRQLVVGAKHEVDFAITDARLPRALADLTREGFVVLDQETYRLAK